MSAQYRAHETGLGESARDTDVEPFFRFGASQSLSQRCDSPRPDTRKISQPWSKDSKAPQAGPWGATYSRLGSYIAPSAAAHDGGVTQDGNKCPSPEHGRAVRNRAHLEPRVNGAGCRSRVLDQSRWLPKFGGRVVLRGKRLRVSWPDRGDWEGLGHRRQGIRSVRRGHPESGRKDMDLPQARSYPSLRLRTAPRFVTRRPFTSFRGMVARPDKSQQDRKLAARFRRFARWPRVLLERVKRDRVPSGRNRFV
jgi:hypothetical protein